MPILFFTQHISKVRYSRLIRRQLYEIYNYDMSKVIKFLDVVKIKIYPISATRLDFFDHIKTTSGQKISKNMASGYAGKFEVVLFLHDSKLNSLGFKFRQNAIKIGHELNHEVLFVEGKRDHVTPIHVRDEENNHFTFWFWTLKPFVKLPITMIDARDLI